MNTMDRRDTLLGARGLTDARDWLLNADEPLADLQARCGGRLPGPLAIPELLELVRQGRRMGLKIAREFSAYDGDALVSGFARIHPEAADDAGASGGCEVLVENWQRSVPTAPEGRAYAERLDAIDRATAEVSARLDARQRVQVLSALAPDAIALQHASLGAPGQVWSDLVALQGVAHHQPLHWRLLDGAACRLAGSQRHWRVRLIPLGPDPQAPAGFELLLIADEPLTAELAGEGMGAAGEAPPTRLIGSALTPVLRQQLKLDEKVQGVVIAGISPSSDAATKGLQRGDVILKIGQKPVTSPAEAADAVDAERKAGKDTVLMLVQRGNTPGRYTGVKLIPPKG